MDKLCCPNCKTNKSRFYIIDQVPRAVKLTGEPNIDSSINMVEDPFFVPYSGPEHRVQCGVCGIIENSEQFIKAATLNS
jgi:rubredoxin